MWHFLYRNPRQGATTLPACGKSAKQENTQHTHEMSDNDMRS